MWVRDREEGLKGTEACGAGDPRHGVFVSRERGGRRRESSSPW